MNATVETKLSISDMSELVGQLCGRKGGKSFDTKSMAIHHLNGTFKSRVGSRLFERYSSSLLACQNINTAKHLIKLVCDEADGKIPSTLEGDFKPQGDTSMTKTVSAPIDTQESAPAATDVGRKGRKSTYAGMTLNATGVTNDRRAGSHGFNSLQIVIDNPGITVEDYLDKGGRPNDLKWDIEKGRIAAA